MYGAILGDIIGSPYEFDQGYKTKDFPLFSRNSKFVLIDLTQQATISCNSPKYRTASMR